MSQHIGTGTGTGIESMCVGGGQGMAMVVERWFSELTTKWLRRGTHTSVTDLKDSINAWIDNWNDNPKPFTWHKPADEILETLATYLQRIPHSGH